MTDKVVDASVVVALVFNETTREAITARLRGASLHAPTLLPFEVANAGLKKMRASPSEKQALREALALFDAMTVELQQVDLFQVFTLAERMGLSVYDATYLWLARALDVELATLDDRLARAEQTLSGGRRGRS